MSQVLLLPWTPFTEFEISREVYFCWNDGGIFVIHKIWFAVTVIIQMRFELVASPANKHIILVQW